MKSPKNASSAVNAPGTLRGREPGPSPHAEVGRYILGIEGGATKTTWCLLDSVSGQLLQRGRGGPGNIRLISDAGLSRLLHQIAESVSTQPDAIGATFAGLSDPDDFAAVESRLRALFPSARYVSAREDLFSGFYAAHPDRDGVLVIAGTGSAVVGHKQGHWARAGGWGHIFGDGGSAWDIARRGLRAAFRDFDRTGTTSPLAQQFLRHTGCCSMRQLVRWIMDRAEAKSDVASLAACVFDAAPRDPGADRCIQRATEELAESTALVIRRLRLTHPLVGLTGGLFEARTEFRKRFQRTLKKHVPKAECFLVTEPGDLGAARTVCARPLPSIPTEPPELRKDLVVAATEQIRAKELALERLSIEQLVDAFAARNDEVNAALRAARPRLVTACRAVATALRQGGRLFYVGAGTSGRLGVLDAAEIPPTFGADPHLVQAILAGGPDAVWRAAEGAEDDEASARAAVRQRGVGPKDVVLGITASGRTPFVLAALEEARTLGARRLLLTCNPKASVPRNLATRIDLDTGAELLAGSTRLGAGTATKLALNVISTVVMVRLGRVAGGRMIDLRATNDKLRDRAARIVMDLAQVPFEEAWRRLKEAGWSVRSALNDGTKAPSD